MAALGIRSQLKLISVGVNLALPASPTNAYVVIDMSTQCSEGEAQLAFDQQWEALMNITQSNKPARSSKYRTHRSARAQGGG